jgi:16S rRNA (cytosine967-C5)-methyltransferase
MRPRGARDVARETLVRVDRARAWATPALDAELRRAGLPSRDAALATDLVYGVLRMRGRLDRALGRFAPRGLLDLPPRARAALRLGAYELLFLRTPAYAAVDEAVRAVALAGGRRVAGFCNAALRRLASEGEGEFPDAATDPLAAVVEHESYPEWLARLMIEELGAAEAVALAAAMNEPAPVTLRVRAGRITRSDAMRRIAAERPDSQLEEGKLASQAIVTRNLGPVASLPAHRDGLVTVQDEAAQFVGHLLAPRPGERVLDACAGAGGKATHLAELMEDRGRVEAADRNERKLRLLAEACLRLGLRSVQALAGDLLDLTVAPGPYDRVLLDAPCSGLGVLRRHPEARWRLRPEDLPPLCDLQRRMLDAAAARVRSGGVLVYSVCSFVRREGRTQIDDLVARSPELVVEEQRLTLPHRDGCDAFYMARLRRP